MTNTSGAPGQPLLLPAWARVTDRRRAHIARVVALLAEWGAALGLDEAAREAWVDAGRLHDALRDAPEDELRALSDDARTTTELLHGPAAAGRLAGEGETRQSVLRAIRFHTTAHPAWDRVGRALYMADYLEPGRAFARAERAFLARQVPHDFDGVYREVLRARIEWALREGRALPPETVGAWNAVV